jgi:hypothetical protein
MPVLRLYLSEVRTAPNQSIKERLECFLVNYQWLLHLMAAARGLPTAGTTGTTCPQYQNPLYSVAA